MAEPVGERCRIGGGAIALELNIADERSHCPVSVRLLEEYGQKREQRIVQALIARSA
jgi:hypothetical protein